MIFQRHNLIARQSRQKGFALPLALVAIASLAIITLVGYRAVAGAGAIVVAVQENAELKRALFSAEAETVFTYLTAPSVPNGIALNTTASAVSPIDGINVSSLSEDQIWRADGAIRLSAATPLPIFVTYFDAAGFPPIDALPEERLAILLSSAGFDANITEQMAARIADFQDPDSLRRFRGAERADYRLFGAPPPTNSPLRSPGELAAVLGYADQAPASSWRFMEEYARFGGIFSQFNPKLGPPALAILNENDENAGNPSDPIDELDADYAQPTDTARFLLSYDGAAGLTRRRAVEIMRTANAPDKPFRRVLIYDKVNDDDGSQTATTEQRDMAPVFQPASGANPR